MHDEAARGCTRPENRWHALPIAATEITKLLASAHQLSTIRSCDTNGAIAPSTQIFPITTLVALNEVVDIDNGLYHFDPICHRLRRCGDALPADLSSIAQHPQWIADASALVVVAASLPEPVAKYTLRGYRFALFEAASLARSLCVAATEHNRRSVRLDGFDDRKINSRLGISGTNGTAVHAIAIG